MLYGVYNLPTVGTYATVTNGYGIFLNTTWPQVYNFGEESEEHYWLEVKGGDLDYYFIYGPSFKVILDRYTDITGKTPLPPKWAFGTWVNTYDDQQAVLAWWHPIQWQRDCILHHLVALPVGGGVRPAAGYGGGRSGGG